ncbi:MAG: DEAD/DEAH box helicase [Gammaproteobacteria bacterium]|nr:DEAD/DEAH box helicase [Gammaproteobacteria bacterium]NNL10262.1 DEAD/DEAH box helicase [Pseudomonadales bacterium]NNM10894.1 DEAD/DEAH box helicase [Pseudomonadales bacterium]
MSESQIQFSDLSLSAAVLQALKNVGYEQPTPVQAQAIPLLLQGHDILGTAQTGTGKTAAFALPILSKLDLSLKKPQALVLAPTRELAIQVAEAMQTYSAQMKGFHVLPVYGGQGMGNQLSQLRRGVHVVVGTPGRIMDHLRRKTLKLDSLKTVVLDEADEMLRMGFIDDVQTILDYTPEQRQIALFSATMPAPIRKIADKHLKQPKIVRIETRTKTVEATDQKYWSVSGTNKLDALTRLLEMETIDGMVIFVRTKSSTVELADRLEARGYAASPINGDMSQQLREKTITQLKNGAIDVLVATDVAARGIDVSRISHVINYDMPYDAETYVHRIGRTGRAGRSGKAILFVAPRERRLLKSIEKMTGQTIDAVDLPTRKQVSERRINNFKNKVKLQLAETRNEAIMQLMQEILDESEHSALELAAAMTALAQSSNPLFLPPEKTGKSRDKASEGKRNKKDFDKPKSRASESRPEAFEGRPIRSRKAKAIIDDDGETVDMETFRIAVGHEHEVQPGDIVGAIANEADIQSKYIGRVQIFDNHSTVELPAGMPKEVFRHLQSVRVRQQKLSIARSDASDTGRRGNRRSAMDIAKESVRKPKKRAASKKPGGTFNKKAGSKKPHSKS